MHKRIFLLALLLLVFSGCTMRQGYDNIFKGFSTTYPYGWSIYEDGMRVVFFPPEGGMQVVVLVTYSAENVTMENLSQTMKARVTARSMGYTIINEGERSLLVGGEPAVEESLETVQHANGTEQWSFSKYVFLRKDDRYFMIFMLFSPQDQANILERKANYERIFDAMVSDFRIL